MASVLGVKVTNYIVEVFNSSTIVDRRRISLKLETGQSVTLRFVPLQPANWIQILGFNVHAFLPLADFDDYYRVLQTEKPLFFNARDEPMFLLVDITTSPEPLGEGPSDLGGAP
jgi:hypothetical protein